MEGINESLAIASNSLPGQMIQYVDPTTLKIVVVFLIIFLGFLLSRIGGKLLRLAVPRKQRYLPKEDPIVRVFHTLIMVVVVIASLIYLNVDIDQNFLYGMYGLIPEVLIIILLLCLVYLIVNFLMFVIDKFLQTAGFMELFEVDQQQHVQRITSLIVRIILFIFVGIAAFNIVGINVNRITSTLSFIFYPMLFFISAILFWGFKEPFANYIASIFIQTDSRYRVGQRIKVGDSFGTVKRFSSLAIDVELPEHNHAIVPPLHFLKDTTIIKTVTTEIESLERMKGLYIEQRRSYCGPACASIILSIWGYDFSQDTIGREGGAKVGRGIHPNNLIKTVKKLTKNDVVGAWVSADQIQDLKQEIRSWLNDGALIIVDYQKSVLFPDATRGHYSICLGLDGDDLVILDPSFKTGGVYLVDAYRMYRGMDTYSNLLKGKRGYVILAPKDTVAGYRLRQGLLYSDPDLYRKRLESKVKKKLTGWVEESFNVEVILPGPVREFVHKLTDRDKVDRVWQASVKFKDGAFPPDQDPAVVRIGGDTLPPQSGPGGEEGGGAPEEVAPEPILKKAAPTKKKKSSKKK